MHQQYALMRLYCYLNKLTEVNHPKESVHKKCDLIIISKLQTN